MFDHQRTNIHDFYPKFCFRAARAGFCNQFRNQFGAKFRAGFRKKSKTMNFLPK